METKASVTCLVLKLVIASAFMLAVFETTDYVGISHMWQLSIVLGALAIVADFWDSIN